jgi:flagella basal body P-ring formation protein FlgA
MRWLRLCRRGFDSSDGSMLNKVRLIARGVAVTLLGLAFAGAAVGEERRLPVPAVTIRAGEVIKEEMIAERAFAANLLGIALFVEARPGLLGRMARRTLLPGQPIPTNAVEDPWAVARGAAVKIVVEDNGLSIVAYGSALQSGAAGSLIPVRNVDTGVIIKGIVEPDGSIKVVDK